MSHLELNAVRAALKGALVGRDAEIDGMLVALLARQHVLLLGPPGTAKSLVTRLLADALGGNAYFERLFTAFTGPEEVFGPWSIAHMEQGKYERLTDRYLPTAEVAFLDEVFKANSAILNSLLTLLNERAFDNGTSRTSCPLQICIGASNEYPEDSSLEALYDRFTMRFWTKPLATAEDKMAMLKMTDATVGGVGLTAEQLANCQKLTTEVKVPDRVLRALIKCSEGLAREGVVVSDRRLRTLVRLVQAHAFLRGDSEADKQDLMVLVDSVWRRHEERPAVAKVVMAIAAPGMARVTRMVDAAREVYERAERDEIELPRALAQIQEIEEAAAAVGGGTEAIVAEITNMRKQLGRMFAMKNPLLRRALGGN